MEINTSAFGKSFLFTNLNSGDVFKLNSALFMKMDSIQVLDGRLVNAVNLDNGIGVNIDEFEHIIPYFNAILTVGETKVV